MSSNDSGSLSVVIEEATTTVSLPYAILVTATIDEVEMTLALPFNTLIVMRTDEAFVLLDMTSSTSVAIRKMLLWQNQINLYFDNVKPKIGRHQKKSLVEFIEELNPNVRFHHNTTSIARSIHK